MKATSGFSADYIFSMRFYERAGRTEVDRFAFSQATEFDTTSRTLEKGAELGKRIFRNEPQLGSVALQISCMMIGRLLPAEVGQGDPSWSLAILL